MSISRSLLAGGPAYVNFKAANIPLSDDSRLEVAPATSVISAALYGDIDEAYTDLIVKGTGTPLTYDNLAALWPYLQPAIGQRIFGNADAPFEWLSNNGDLITVRAGAITRMPDLILSVDKAAVGAMEISGVVGNGLDADSAGSYYSIQTGQAFSPPATATGRIPRQKYTAVWGTQAGFTSFQAQDAWTITHELKLAPVKIQGRTVDMKDHELPGDGEVHAGGADDGANRRGAAERREGAKHGAFLSSNASAADLVITGRKARERDGEERGAEDGGFCVRRQAAEERGDRVCVNHKCEQRDGDGGPGAGVRGNPGAGS